MPEVEILNPKNDSLIMDEHDLRAYCDSHNLKYELVNLKELDSFNGSYAFIHTGEKKDEYNSGNVNHWMFLVGNLVFDSYGLQQDFLLPEWCEYIELQPKRLQEFGSNVCGEYCCTFYNFIIKHNYDSNPNMGLDYCEYMGYTENRNRNDRLVQAEFQKTLKGGEIKFKPGANPSMANAVMDSAADQKGFLDFVKALGSFIGDKGKIAYDETSGVAKQLGKVFKHFYGEQFKEIPPDTRPIAAIEYLKDAYQKIRPQTTSLAYANQTLKPQFEPVGITSANFKPDRPTNVGQTTSSTFGTSTTTPTTSTLATTTMPATTTALSTTTQPPTTTRPQTTTTMSTTKPNLTTLAQQQAQQQNTTPLMDAQKEKDKYNQAEKEVISNMNIINTGEQEYKQASSSSESQSNEETGEPSPNESGNKKPTKKKTFKTVFDGFFDTDPNDPEGISSEAKKFADTAKNFMSNMLTPEQKAEAERQKTMQQHISQTNTHKTNFLDQMESHLNGAVADMRQNAGIGYDVPPVPPDQQFMNPTIGARYEQEAYLPNQSKDRRDVLQMRMVPRGSTGASKRKLNYDGTVSRDHKRVKAVTQANPTVTAFVPYPVKASKGNAIAFQQAPISIITAVPQVTAVPRGLINEGQITKRLHN